MNIKRVIKKNKTVIALFIGSLLAYCVYCYLKNKEISTKNQTENQINNTFDSVPSSSGNDINRLLGGTEIGVNMISPPIQSEVNLGSGFGRGAINEPQELQNINFELDDVNYEL